MLQRGVSAEMVQLFVELPTYRCAQQQTDAERYINYSELLPFARLLLKRARHRSVFVRAA